jgi:hypothetical protein
VTAPPPEEIYKSSDLKIVCYLHARGCRIKDVTLRPDRRVDFFMAGTDVFALTKEFEMGSMNTLVPIHALYGAQDRVRDAITRAKNSTKAG